MKTENIAEAIKAVPPIGVGGLSLCGLQLSEWVVIMTLIYTLFLIVDKLPVVLERARQFWDWLTK